MNREVKLLKIDVEGFEKFVLEGAGEALEQVAFIYFEVMNAHFVSVGYSFSDIFNILDKYKFRVIELIGEELRFLHNEESFEECKNIFAVRDVSEFRRRMDMQE